MEGSKPYSLNVPRRVAVLLKDAVTEMNGATGCDSQDPGANKMVIWNGCGPKTEWPGENMC